MHNFNPFQPWRSDFKVFKLCDDDDSDEMFHVARAGHVEGYRPIKWVPNSRLSIVISYEKTNDL